MLLFIRKIMKSMLLAGIHESKAVGPGGPNQDQKMRIWDRTEPGPKIGGPWIPG